MRIKLLLSCLALSFALSTMAASAATPAPPKVVFTGDQFMYNWQQSSAFQANTNWSGVALDNTGSLFGYGESAAAAANFQTALNRHPAVVFIETGTADMQWITDSNPFGFRWEQGAQPIIQMVQMAQKANVKVILGNVIWGGFTADYFNGWIQTYAQSQNIPVVNLQYYLVNGCFGVVPPPPGTWPAPCDLLTSYGGAPGSVPVPTDMGFQFITQLAQTAIQTLNLTIKSGYLSTMWTDNVITGAPTYQVNSVPTGAGVQFTAEATWSDGATRPMWNYPFQGAFNTAALGTWTSSNPKVITINQQGHAVAYTSGPASISFKSATGQTFSPWTMTVTPWYTEYGVLEPVY